VRGPQYAWANAKRLEAALAEAGIGYTHLREFAPTTEMRQLQYREDARLGEGKRSRTRLSEAYAEAYAREILDPADLLPLEELMRKGLPALLCVERDAVACHRSLIAARLESDAGIEVEHLAPGFVPASPLHTEIEREGVRDSVAVEEPLEIRVDGEPLSVTMRTPGNDEELAFGFLFGEGLIDGPRPAGPDAELSANVVEVEGPLLRDPGRRRFYTTSSCGVCGKGALAEVAVASEPAAPGPAVGRALLAALPERLEQPAFERTGGIHATGLFDAEGRLLVGREDVGRHNAMDKVIGRALLDGLVPLHGHLLCVSGRLSFELVQKAAVAGCPVLVGVGAPSSLAIELAADRGMTLAGFARRGRLNVYAGAERVSG
jgi:FdhD protein